MRDLLDRIGNVLRDVGDRARNEAPMEASLVGVAAYIAEDADSIGDVAAVVGDRPWAVAAIVTLGVVARQSVWCKRSHDVDVELAAAGEDS